MNRLKFDNPIDCSGCGACAAICPRHCIEMTKDTLGFNIPNLVNSKECIDCGLCYKTCPQIKKKDDEIQRSLCIYGQNKDKNQLLESSSGGFFSLLATHIIDLGGCVWGVELLKNGMPSFVCIHQKEDLKRIRGSKYSEVAQPIDFIEIKRQVKNGILVLVSGTPCQILALRKFLGKNDYPNLILVDLLCYGIQSPKMWRQYLKDINPKNKGISYISMRNKRYSWFNYSMKIIFDDGTKYQKIRYKDPWLLTYSTSIFNRLSCSACQSKKNPHVSDFTIGDFWDIDYYNNPIKLKKSQGVSLAMMHTQKAKNLFERIEGGLIYDTIPYEYMDKRNITLAKSANINNLRDVFIKEANELGFSHAVKKYLDSGFSLWYKKRKNYLKFHTIWKMKLFVKHFIGYKKK